MPNFAGCRLDLLTFCHHRHGHLRHECKRDGVDVSRDGDDSGLQPSFTEP